MGRDAPEEARIDVGSTLDEREREGAWLSRGWDNKLTKTQGLFALLLLPPAIFLKNRMENRLVPAKS